MESLNTYINKQNLTNYITEEELIKYHGKELDNIFYKFDRYTKLISNDNINESIYFNNYRQNDILFNTQEQTVATKLLINIVENYAISLMKEEGLITENFVNEGIFQKIADYSKEKSKSISTGLSNIKNKFGKLYKFIKELTEKGIKSVKEMFWKLTDMMLALGCKFEQLVDKLKMDKQKAISDLMNKIKSLFKKIKSGDSEVKQNVYESLSNKIIVEEENNSEAEEENNSEAEEENNSKENNNSNQNGASWKSLIGNAAKTILIQMFAYYAVTLLLPAIITLIGGPVAGAIAECLGKIIWSSGVVFLQAKKEYDLHKSGEFDKKYNTKWKKFFHYTFFLFNICWAAWKAISAGMDMGKICSALSSGNQDLIKSILPSEGVQKITTVLNKAWKAVTGQNAAGFDKLQEHIAHVENGIIEEVSKLIGGHDGLTDDQIKAAFEQNHFKSSMDAINYFKDKGLVSDLNGLSKLTATGNSSIIFDGFFDPSKNKWSKELTEAWKKYGGKPEDLEKLMKQGFNAGLNAKNANAGSMAAVVLPNKFLKFCGENGINLGNGGHFSVLGSETTIKVIKKVFKAISPIQNTLDLFGGLFPWGSSKNVEKTVEPAPVVVEDGEGFRVRLGSEKDKDNFIYEISKGGVKREKMSEVTSKIKDKNSVLIEKINGYFTDIKKSLNEKLEHTEDEEDKKKFNKHLDEIEKLIKDQEVTIFYGKKVEIEEKNESYISLTDYLILEGNKITNKRIKDSLDSIIDYFSNKVAKNTKSAYILSKDDKLKAVDISKTDSDGKEKTDKQVKDEQKASNALSVSRKLKHILTTGDVSEIQQKIKSDDNNDNKANIKLKGDELLNAVFIPFAKVLFAAEIFGKESVTGDANKDYKYIAILLKEITSLYQTVLKDNDSEGNNFDFKNEISEPQKRAYFNIVKHLKSFKPIVKAIENKDIKIEKIDEPEGAQKQDKKAKELIDNNDNETQKDIITAITDPDKGGNSGDSHEDSKDNHENTDEKTDESDEEVPVLVWSPIFIIGCDLANATDSGPRKDVYTMKNMYENYQYLTFEGGLSEAGIEKFLGEELIANAIGETYNVSVSKPAIENNGTFKVNTDEGIEADKERDDFGKFTNNEITEILNDNSKGKNYLKGSTSGKISKSDKKKIEATQSKIKETIKDNDKLQDYCKNSKTLKNVIDEDGNINDEELDKVSYAVTQEQAKENSGFWGRVKSFFSNIFGGSSSSNSNNQVKYDDSEVKELLKQIKELLEKKEKENSTNESLNESLFNNKNYKVSLKDYIYNKQN